MVTVVAPPTADFTKLICPMTKSEASTIAFSEAKLSLTLSEGVKLPVLLTPNAIARIAFPAVTLDAKARVLSPALLVPEVAIL